MQKTDSLKGVPGGFFIALHAETSFRQAVERTVVMRIHLSDPELQAVHERELQRGSRNRATLAVARKLVAYLLAVDRSGEPFAPRTRAA